MARPKKYLKKYCKMMLDYFNREPTYKEEMLNGQLKTIEVEKISDLPTFEGFATSIGVCDDTIVNWTKEFPEFLATYKICKSYQKYILVQNGLNGNYNSNFAKFVAINATDMVEKKEIKHSGEIKTINIDEKINEIEKNLDDNTND